MRRRLLILTTVLFLIAGAAYLYVASGRLHQRVRLALEAAAGREVHRPGRPAAPPRGPPPGPPPPPSPRPPPPRPPRGRPAPAARRAAQHRRDHAGPSGDQPRDLVRRTLERVRSLRAAGRTLRRPRRVHPGGDAGGWGRDRYRFLRAAPSIPRALGRSKRTGGPPPGSRGAAGVRPGQRA